MILCVVSTLFQWFASCLLFIIRAASVSLDIGVSDMIDVPGLRGNPACWVHGATFSTCCLPSTKRDYFQECASPPCIDTAQVGPLVWRPPCASSGRSFAECCGDCDQFGTCETLNANATANEVATMQIQGFQVFLNASGARRWFPALHMQQRRCLAIPGTELTTYWIARVRLPIYVSRVSQMAGGHTCEMFSGLRQEVQAMEAFNRQPFLELGICASILLDGDLLARALKAWLFLQLLAAAPGSMRRTDWHNGRPASVCPELNIHELFMQRGFCPLCTMPTTFIASMSPRFCWTCPLRSAFVDALPLRGSRVLELGVYSGGFSVQLLRRGPSQLFLADVWNAVECPSNVNASCIVSASDSGTLFRWNNLFRSVRAKFSAETSSGQVVIMRGIGDVVAPRIPNGFLDVVYIDACHDYSCVRRDLAAFVPKLRPGGLLCGHDFSLWGYEFCDTTQLAPGEQFYDCGFSGVAIAINEWLAERPEVAWYAWSGETDFCLRVP